MLQLMGLTFLLLLFFKCVHYDIKKSAVIQCNASSEGLGATLLQEGKPVVQSSENYVALELECLVVQTVHLWTKKTVGDGS